MNLRRMGSTIRELATATGLSVATVSMALRGTGRMSAETRARVQAAAKKAGYQPSLLLSKALSMVRQPEGKRHYRETLGFIAEFAVKGGPSFQRNIYEGAVERAHKVGFNIEPFVLAEKPAEHRQLGRMLRARGIRGLVIMPRLLHRMPRMFMPWEHFAAVEIGKTIWTPRNLHRVERPLYYELIEAFHVLKRVGYKRIGLAVEPMEDKNRRGVYTAAYLLWQRRIRQPLAPFSTEAWTIEKFRVWFEEQRPDVIVVHDTRSIPVWLKTMGVKVPDEVSVFSSNVGETNISGLRADLPGLGSGAVEMLSLLLDHNELGLSPRPRCWEVEDYWQPGDTLSRPIADYISADGTVVLGRFAGSPSISG
ncbi:LacI family DNA-binding transcriptional regulator [Rariglobus hedericola]|uniref:LacI family transcriptional regulator n=1 Tax=Rariglobus hedericola TaxID=2597822 RepID=A0A556QPJ3_9BACT|nr:LacI family DNA-binding transcriptional regulator [Rariglobus hedericola]TSJ78564.1 LacI family transcriptional regulator [Rariglobus hedericola]